MSGSIQFTNVLSPIEGSRQITIDHPAVVALSEIHDIETDEDQRQQVELWRSLNGETVEGVKALSTDAINYLGSLVAERVYKTSDKEQPDGISRQLRMSQWLAKKAMYYGDTITYENSIAYMKNPLIASVSPIRSALSHLSLRKTALLNKISLIKH